MINRETAKQFLETRGYPNPECDYENELLDTLVEYAQQQAKNNEVLDLVILSDEQKEKYYDLGFKDGADSAATDILNSI